MDIDFVIPWVDGSDPAWQAEKARYDTEKLNDGNSVNRFRDWGLLPYWFRAVEKFTPWVNKIHFITWGHLPEFLNTEHPGLHIVNHRDYIPEEYLPTFSANTIEMNLHRIPELAENFVYFNDDMFMLRPLPPKKFFRNCLPCAHGGEYPIKLIGNLQIWQHLEANDLAAINASFDKKKQVAKYRGKYINPAYPLKDNLQTLAMEVFLPNHYTGFRMPHAPAAYRKQTFRDVWEAHPELLQRTCESRFRGMDGANQWLCLWWQVAGGQFTPARINCFLGDVGPNTIDLFCQVIRTQSNDMTCINDPFGEVDFEALSAQLRDAFDEILPEKCSFEK